MRALVNGAVALLDHAAHREAAQTVVIVLWPHARTVEAQTPGVRLRRRASRPEDPVRTLMDSRPRLPIHAAGIRQREWETMQGSISVWVALGEIGLGDLRPLCFTINHKCDILKT